MTNSGPTVLSSVNWHGRAREIALPLASVQHNCTGYAPARCRRIESLYTDRRTGRGRVAEPLRMRRRTLLPVRWGDFRDRPRRPQTAPVDVGGAAPRPKRRPSPRAPQLGPAGRSPTVLSLAISFRAASKFHLRLAMAHHKRIWNARPHRIPIQEPQIRSHEVSVTRSKMVCVPPDILEKKSEGVQSRPPIAHTICSCPKPAPDRPHDH